MPLSRRSAYLLSLSWLLFVGLFFFRDWHPVNLVIEQAPVIPQDILAAVIKLTMEGMPVIGLLAVGVLAAIGAGGLVLRPLRLELDAGQRITLSVALGLGVLSYLAFFTGILRGYNPFGRAADIAVIAVLAVLGARQAYKAVRVAGFGEKAGWEKAAFWALLVVVGVFLFAKALKPAVFYDALAYHLSAPNYYLTEGGIVYNPYDSVSNFPFMAEMLYTLGMFLSGLKLAQLSSVLMFLLCCLAVYDFSRSELPGISPAVPATIFLLTPAFMENAVLFGNDLHIVYYTVLVFYCFFNWERRRETGYVILMGIFAGLCLGTKYTALASTVAPVVLAVLYTSLKRGGLGLRKGTGVLLLFSIVVLLADSPWLIKNLVYTGNPLYPAFYNILGGKDMSPDLYRSLMAMSNHPDLHGALTGLYRNLWDLFLLRPADIVRTYGAAAYLGPFLLMFVPLTLLLENVPPTVKKLCLVAAAMFVLWDVASNFTRFLYPALALLAIISGYALTKAAKGAPVYFKAVLFCVAAFLLVFNICLGFFLVNNWAAASGFGHMSETDDEYLQRRMNMGRGVVLFSLPVFNLLNEAQGVGKVLVIGDAQHLYIHRRHIYTYYSATTPYQIFKDDAARPGDIYNGLAGQGVTHIVYCPEEMRRLQRAGVINYKEEDDRYIEDFLKGPYVRLVAKSGTAGANVYLFELRPGV